MVKGAGFFVPKHQLRMMDLQGYKSHQRNTTTESGSQRKNNDRIGENSRNPYRSDIYNAKKVVTNAGSQGSVESYKKGSNQNATRKSSTNRSNPSLDIPNNHRSLLSSSMNRISRRVGPTNIVERTVKPQNSRGAQDRSHPRFQYRQKNSNKTQDMTLKQARTKSNYISFEISSDPTKTNDWSRSSRLSTETNERKKPSERKTRSDQNDDKGARAHMDRTKSATKYNESDKRRQIRTETKSKKVLPFDNNESNTEENTNDYFSSKPKFGGMNLAVFSRNKPKQHEKLPQSRILDKNKKSVESLKTFVIDTKQRILREEGDNDQDSSYDFFSSKPKFGGMNLAVFPRKTNQEINDNDRKYGESRKPDKKEDSILVGGETNKEQQISSRNNEHNKVKGASSVHFSSKSKLGGLNTEVFLSNDSSRYGHSLVIPEHDQLTKIENDLHTGKRKLLQDSANGKVLNLLSSTLVYIKASDYFCCFHHIYE